MLIKNNNNNNNAIRNTVQKLGYILNHWVKFNEKKNESIVDNCCAICCFALITTYIYYFLCLGHISILLVVDIRCFGCRGRKFSLSFSVECRHEYNCFVSDLFFFVHTYIVQYIFHHVHLCIQSKTIDVELYFFFVRICTFCMQTI